MSRKNKAFRAFLYQNPNPAIEEVWNAAWANQQSCFQSKRMQDQDDRIAALEGFARELLKLSDFRDDIDGGDFQNVAIKYGILKGVEVTEPCSPLCNCADYFGADDFPQTCYRSTIPEEQGE